MVGQNRAPLSISIALVLAVYSIVETAGVVWVGLAFSLPQREMGYFYVIQALFHALLATFLMLGRRFFYIESSGERLSKVNIANKVTLLRVSIMPTLVFLIVQAKGRDLAAVLMPLLAATFLTDMVDGKLSRARNEVTVIGKILDSVSDYFLLTVIAIAYRAYDLLPTWLFLIILFRLAFQALGMLGILIVRKRVEPTPTMFGKVAVATIMMLFAIEALRLVATPDALGYFVWIEAAAGIIVGLSVLEKAYCLSANSKARFNPPEEISTDR